MAVKSQFSSYNLLADLMLSPTWEKIFKGDTERKHNFESAKKEFDELLIKYKNFGYETVLIPKVLVKDRADFILEKLGAQTKYTNAPNFFIARTPQSYFRHIGFDSLLILSAFRYDELLQYFIVKPFIGLIKAAYLDCFSYSRKIR